MARLMEKETFKTETAFDDFGSEPVKKEEKKDEKYTDKIYHEEFI
jgi:hypothetical protein